MVCHRQRLRGWREHQACGHWSITSRPRVGHSKSQKPQAEQPGYLAGSSALSFPKLLGTRLSRVTSLSVPQGGREDLKTSATLRWMDGWDPLPPCGSFAGELYGSTTLCLWAPRGMLTQEAVSLMGYVHLWVTGDPSPLSPVSGGPRGSHYVPASEAFVHLASVPGLVSGPVT